MKMKTDLAKRLNLEYINLYNKTKLVGKYDFPILYCDLPIFPDYIALYSQPSEYHKTSLTALSFYNYDNQFDGQNGLYNAIYYNNKKDLNFYKQRFQGIDFFIEPDYSVCGDIDNIENIYRIKKARLVSLWIAIELHAIVIPNITYSEEKDFEYFLDGLDEVRYVCFSTKGAITNKRNTYLLMKAVKLVTDNLKFLKGIIVFDVCKDNLYVSNIFKYAIDNGIEIIIPDNCLKMRNISRLKQNISINQPNIFFELNY